MDICHPRRFLAYVTSVTYLHIVLRGITGLVLQLFLFLLIVDQNNFRVLSFNMDIRF